MNDLVTVMDEETMAKRRFYDDPKAVVIICGRYHCHPSGNPKPSREDAITTQRLKDAGNILDIKMVDHIIVGCGNDRSYSFAAHGLLSADSVLHAYENEFGSWER